MTKIGFIDKPTTGVGVIMILIICQCSKIFNMCLKLTWLNKKKKTNYSRDFFLLTVKTKIQIKLQKKPRTNIIF